MWDEPWSARFCANALVTDRRLLLWWKGVRGRPNQMVILGHDFMFPSFDEKGKRLQGTIPYMWFGAIFTSLSTSDATHRLAVRRIRGASLMLTSGPMHKRTVEA